MEVSSSMANASLMMSVSTSALKLSIDNSEEMLSEVIEAISSGENGGLDIYA